MIVIFVHTAQKFVDFRVNTHANAFAHTIIHIVTNKLLCLILAFANLKHSSSCFINRLFKKGSWRCRDLPLRRS